MGTKVLVTGAAGFLGSRLVRQLIEAGESVKGVVRASSNLQNLADLPRDKLDLIAADVTVEHSIYRALAGCDRLYHVAAVNRLWASNPKDVLDAAIIGTQETLSAAKKRGIQRVVCTSSVATLGATSSPEEMDESHEFNLPDPEMYIEGKKKAEDIALGMNEEGRFEVIAALPSAILGPGDLKPSPAGEAMIRFLSWDMPLIDFPVVEGGLNYVDVDDVARGHILAMQKGKAGQRYILGGENLTFEQVFSLASELAGVGAPGSSVPKGLVELAGRFSELRARLGGPEPMITYRAARDYVGAYAWVTSARAEKELGYTHRSARKAVARSIQWLLEKKFLHVDAARRIRVDLRAPA